MKKAIFILAALMMLVSSVAAVSAYEAHIINVTAHVENALTVNTENITYGVMFPQEWNKIKRSIRLSTSANESLTANTSDPVHGDLKEVKFKIYAEWKEDPYDGTADDLKPDVLFNNKDYVAWIGEWLWVAYPEATQTTGVPMADPSQWANVGTAPDYTTTPPTMAKQVGSTEYTLSDNSLTYVDILFLAPVFEGYYNEFTDDKPDWWPPNWTNPGPWPWIGENDLRHEPEGVDLGLDLKIQITDIVRWVVIQ